MYLKNLAIKNVGPIEELSLELPFNDYGNPKPVVFVGENGTGKTVLQSQVVDAFYEIGSSLFHDIGELQGINRVYYKISGERNLQMGKEKGFSLLRFVDMDNQILEYFDKMGEAVLEDFAKYISGYTLSPDSSKTSQKKITDIDDPKREKLRNEWQNSANFYQPAYRYEEPFWKGRPYKGYPRFEDIEIFSGELGKELEIISSTNDNKAFLLDLVLDRYVHESDPNNIALWESINSILRVILNNGKYRLGIGPKIGYRVAIVEQLDEKKSRQVLPSIDNLSLGESILFNLFINIIRHNGNIPKKLDQMQGIVVIDEIDVHLHTELQNVVLPKLIKRFPKVQFIITSHSPLFLLGMANVFGEDGFEVRDMPSGQVISIERFSEFENAYDVYKETEKFEEEVKLKVARKDKVVVFVEGPTDVQYIKRAYELNNLSCDEFDIEIIGESTGSGTKNSNNNALKNAQKVFCTNLELLNRKVILLNDPEESVEDCEYERKLYIRKIPQTDQNILQKGIENLFENDFIENVKQQKPECFEYHVVGKEEKNYKILDGKKKTVCDWICENGSSEDFKNFEKIFEIIKDVLSSGECID